jgi:multiple sugar transport system substrate-binding protein
LAFIGWQYNPQIVAENVEIFKKLYDENVNYELVPGEYHAIAETKLIAGQHVDMMYSEEDRLVRWNTAGWTRDIEGLPGLDEIKAKMYAINVKNISLPDGKLGGLPYYTGFNSFVANQKHLDAAKIEPPATWGEMLDQARKLKKDKISEYPYIAAWGRQWASLSWELFSMWYSEGAKVFDANSDLVVDQPFRNVLELHRTIYEEQLIPQDVFTHLGESVPNFATGQHTYMVVHEYDQKVFNTPSSSQIAGACRNAIMPGKTRSTFIWTALYQMGAQADEERGWNLMQFFGGKAKDGKYHVATRWALEFGLGTPHKEVIESPEVQEASRSGRTSRWQRSSLRPPPPATSPRSCGSRSGTGT